jgi:hypothetical protein
MLERMKHGIVGAGPCGTLTALILLEAGHEVVLFDVNDRTETSKKELKSNLKLTNGSASPYDINQSLRLRVQSSPATFYRSKVLGGFSNVWGATWGSVLINDGQEWKKHFEAATERVFESLAISPENGSDFGCSCFNFLSDSIQKKDTDCFLNFSKTQLAINPNVCNCINSGQTSCVHGSVWNSKSLLDECAGHSKFSFKDGVDVTKIEVGREDVAILDDDKTYSFDAITVAAGPLGSAEIMLNSFPNLDKIKISDTLMGYVPFFRFKLNDGHSGAFAFSQYRFDLELGHRDLRVHIQLYSHSEVYLDRILGKLPKLIRPIFGKMADFILPHIGIALIYLDSKASSSLSISKGVDDRNLDIKVFGPEIRARGLRRKLIGAFRALKIFPFVGLISWTKPGESYHLGAGAKDLLDEYGFVKIDKRISFAGSLALPRVDPGPITHASMAQSSRLAEKIIHQNFESN